MILRRAAGTGRLPLLIQSEAAECGLACIAMIASFHGHALDLNEARHRFRISSRGMTLKDMVAFAGSIGLSGRALRLEPAGLRRLKCPAVLHMDMNHFVVLKEMRGAEAVVHDPAHGLRRLRPGQIDRRFTGIALELTPAPDFAPKLPAPNLGLVDLARNLDLPRGTVAKALLLSVMLQLLVLAAPLYVQLAIDRGAAQGDSGVLLPLALGFGLLLALRGAVGWIRAKVLLAFSGMLGAQLVSNVVRHMLRLPHGWYERRHVSSLLSRVSSTQPIRDLIGEGLAAAVVDGMMALFTICLALAFAPALAAIVLSGFATLAAVKIWQVRRSMEREQEFIEAFARAQQEFIETVRGIAPVKLFRKEQDRERRWMDRHVETVNARYSLDSVRARADVARDLVNGAVLALVVYVGVGQVIAGATSLGVLMAFVTYQQLFAESGSRLLDFAARYRLLRVHLQRLSDVVGTEPEAAPPSAVTAPGDRLSGAVAARNLCFRYGAFEEAVLSGVCLDVGAGEFVAITGPSGAGKTTLLKILVGLLRPESGTVLYDGRVLDELTMSAVRDQIGVVMQDDVLLSGSLAQNITFFDSQPDLEWMAECARMAAIDEEISFFPMRYDTLVGDMGTVLSGGQRQRVLLARALYRRPRILFMDEGTSSLDLDREREVNANLAALDLTRIVIAHRKDTIDAAERVLELVRNPSGTMQLDSRR